MAKTSGGSRSTASAKAAGKKDEPKVRESLESTFLDYLRAIYGASADSQQRTTDIYRAYVREVGDTQAELQKRLEDLQRDYLAGIREAFGNDDATARAEQAYADGMAAYRRLLEEARVQGEEMNNKLLSLLNQEGEGLQKRCVEAFTSYLDGLRGVTQKLDGKSVGLPELEYLSQTVGAVAMYAGATGALPGPDRSST